MDAGRPRPGAARRKHRRARSCAGSAARSAGRREGARGPESRHALQHEAGSRAAAKVKSRFEEVSLSLTPAVRIIREAFGEIAFGTGREVVGAANLFPDFDAHGCPSRRTRGMKAFLSFQRKQKESSAFRRLSSGQKQALDVAAGCSEFVPGAAAKSSSIAPERGFLLIELIAEKLSREAVHRIVCGEHFAHDLVGVDLVAARLRRDGGFGDARKPSCRIGDVWGPRLRPRGGGNS